MGKELVTTLASYQDDDWRPNSAIYLRIDNGSDMNKTLHEFSMLEFDTPRQVQQPQILIGYYEYDTSLHHINNDVDI